MRKTGAEAELEIRDTAGAGAGTADGPVMPGAGAGTADGPIMPGAGAGTEDGPIMPGAGAGTEDARFMREAVRQAKKAGALGEVPIGCVLVREGKIYARGYNRRITDHSTLAHAELTAIRRACKKFGDWRLEDCTLYVTLEPCPMCAGAIVQARIPRVVFGTRNPKAGSAGSCVDLLHVESFNHQVEVTEGVLKEECALLLKDFFRELRRKAKEKKQVQGEVNGQGQGEVKPHALCGHR